MRVSLLQLLLWLATAMGCDLFVGRSAVCVGGYVMHIRPLSTPVKHVHITPWALFILVFEPTVEFFQNESAKKAFWLWILGAKPE